MTELKPCPFCGNENVYWNDGGWIECRGCNIFFQVAFTNADKEENIDCWNTRVDCKTENCSEKLNNCEDEPQTSGVVWTEDAIKNEPKSYTTWVSTDELQTKRPWGMYIIEHPMYE